MGPYSVGRVMGLESLIGRQLTEVAFVMDYVELRFDGPILRALASPTVQREQTDWKIPDPGARDALCGLIGNLVEEAEDLSDEICITMSSASIHIPKGSPDAGPEAAHFVPYGNGRLDLAHATFWENTYLS